MFCLIKEKQSKVQNRFLCLYKIMNGELKKGVNEFISIITKNWKQKEAYLKCERKVRHKNLDC